MAISTTSLLRYIKRQLGASHKPLPLDDEAIIDTVLDETLYTFSNHFPYMYDIGVYSSHTVPGKNGCYFLETDGLEVLGVAKVFRGNIGPFIEGYPGQYIGPSDGLNNQLITDLASYTQVPNTFEFIAPNMVEIFPKNITYEERLIIRTKCIHPPHLATIPLSLREEFYALALLDVKIALWNILKQYSGLATAVGNIDLRIEDYEAAVSERKDLLEKWNENYLKDSSRQKIFIG